MHGVRVCGTVNVRSGLVHFRVNHECRTVEHTLGARVWENRSGVIDVQEVTRADGREVAAEWVDPECLSRRQIAHGASGERAERTYAFVL